MRKCLVCKNVFDDSWGVCLHCAKPLVAINGGSINMVVQAHKPETHMPTIDEVMDDIGAVLVVLAKVVGFILLALLCIGLSILGIFLFFQFLNWIFGNNDC